MSRVKIRNILIITSEQFPFGMAGTNRIISLSKGFIANGLNTQVLTTAKYGKHGDIVINPTRGVYEGIKFTNVFSTTIKNRYKIVRAFQAYLKSFLVFIFCIKTLDKNTLVLYYSKYTTPALLTNLACKLKGSLFIKEETEHPLIRVIGKPKLYRYFYIKYHYRIFDGLFVITTNLYKYFKDELNYKKPILIVPMIVDINWFKYPSIPINNIVFTGVLDDQKEGVDILIRAFHKVLKTHPDYTLNLFGKAKDEKNEEYYIRMISDLNIDNKIILHGYKIRDEIAMVYSSAKILVFPRPPSLQATYGFSTKLGEYLATGKPVVATRVGEIDRFLKDKKNAFICNPNADSIANKICEIIEDYDFALKVGEEGRKCSLKFFNNESETKKVIELIQIKFNITYKIHSDI